MKSNAILSQLLESIPPLTTNQEGRLQGGFCAFVSVDTEEQTTKGNPNCNCNCHKGKKEKKDKTTNPDCNCNCNCNCHYDAKSKKQGKEKDNLLTSFHVF